MSRVSYLIIFFLILAYLGLKWYNLKDYKIYDAKIIGFEKVNVTMPTSLRGKSNSSYTKITPIVEYYRLSNDTVKYYDGKRVFYSSFNKNEKIRVLEDKRNEYNTTIFSLFYYWLEVSEIILLALLATMIIGFYKVFLKNDKSVI
jgi:hypothetical protein